MRDLSTYLESLGINPTYFAAGVAGASVHAIISEGKTKWEAISGALVGTLCAIYLTPLVVGWMGLDGSQVSTTNAVAFGIGIIGLRLAEGAVRMATDWSKKPRLPSEASLKGLADAVNPPAAPIDIPEEEKPESVKAPVRRKRRS
ncbi:hypothetical protein [Rhizobium sp. 2MFCol3.1]|uniref:hypothetical protein n=1 Tax=Rhizobium sp. 2MFCol3.1 TaxID=1246459 RepID=UPI00037F3C00|nr:hypothetical protein [Rhizobium sp. 2MFCol3.1]